MKTHWLLPFIIMPLMVCAQDADPFAPKPAVPPGWRLVHGDILEPLFKPASAVRNDPNRLWAGGVVPYEFDANVSASRRTIMRNAMALWENVATVQFVVRNGDADYVHIQHSTNMNSSAVGRQGGKQPITITSWGSRIIIAHELAHCLGFYHTQSRPDRDTFVRINTANIQAFAVYNFDIESDCLAYGPYDFDSIMHYGQCDFAINCGMGRCIDVLPPNEEWQTRIGQSDHLSNLDQLVMSLLYPPGDWRFVDPNFSGSPNSGTFLRPYLSFSAGHDNVPAGGTVALQPAHYSAVGTISKAMTLRAPLGGVQLGN